MIRHVRHLFTGIALAAALSCAVFASAQTIYVSTGATGGTTGTLGTITTSGVFTPIGITSVQLTALAFSPTGVLYGAGTDATTGAVTLYTVNPTSGMLTQVGSTGLGNLAQGDQANGLAFSPGGILYTVDANFAGFPNGSSSLYTVNTSTGAATQVGPVGNLSQGTIGFDGSGNLYEINNQLTPNRFDILDQGTGAGTQLGNTAFTDVFGLAFSNGALYGFANVNNRVITINTATGVGTSVATFNTGGTGIILAATPFVSAVPEPSTLALLMSMGVAGTSVFLRRKRATA